MIWIIGGTSESIAFLHLLKNSPVIDKVIVTAVSEYSKTLIGEVSEKISVEIGRKDILAMDEFVKRKDIKLVIDLSHPYAKEVSENAILTAKEHNIQYFRFMRNTFTSDNSISFFNIDDIVDYCSKIEGNILVTLGSNTMKNFFHLKNIKNIYFRILPDPVVIDNALKSGILMRNIIAMQGPFSKDFNSVLIRDLKITHLISKHSGSSGGEMEKIQSAKEMNIILIFLEKPENIEYGVKFTTLDSIVERIDKDGFK